VGCLTEALNTLIEQRRRFDGTPGVVLAVTDRQALREVICCGWADVAAQRPVTPELLFEIGSITKSFTAIALLQLSERGLLDLHAPVSRYLPWFQVRSAFEPITLHHLMTHTAGIIMGTDWSTEARYEVWALRETEAAAPPGTTFHYSNVGYKALGLVLETVLGQDYGEIVRERILQPLDMGASSPVITHEIRQRMAMGHEFLYDDRPPHRSQPLVPATWLETGTADGSIAATAGDMAAYLRMLLNRGLGPHGRILSAESFELLTRPVIAPDDGAHGVFYGYGLNIGQVDGHRVIGHDGGMVGYYASVLADMDAGLGVVVLVNGPGSPEEIARAALALLRADAEGRDLPPLPAEADLLRVERAADYAGAYESEAGTFTLLAEGERLVMEIDGARVPLEPREVDYFYVDHPAFARFLLHFGRRDGQVVEACYGPRCYLRLPASAPPVPDYPPEWDAYPGHYRAHNPWFPNLRVVLRRGRLILIEPRGKEHVLVPLGGGRFRVGEDEHCPERVRFDTLIDGRAVRLNLSCCDYYRTFTP